MGKHIKKYSRKAVIHLQFDLSVNTASMWVSKKLVVEAKNTLHKENKLKVALKKWKEIVQDI